MASPDGAIVSDRSPKRVVVRLKVRDFEGRCSSEYDRAIKAYLEFARRAAIVDEVQRHHAHIEPFQPLELQQTPFHIIIDFEKHSLADGNVQSLPHGIHRVRRSEGSG